MVATVLFGGHHAAAAGLPGSLDDTFQPGEGPDGQVQAIVVQPDGKIVVGGLFRSFAGIATGGLARLSPDGTVDPTFRVGAEPVWPVYALALHGAEGDLLVGGGFSEIDGILRPGLARLLKDGRVDPSFTPVEDPGSTSGVIELAVASSGSVLFGGYGGTGYSVGRLLANGLPDPDSPYYTPDHAVRAIVLDAEGGILVGGEFGSLDLFSYAPYLARLRPDGELDSSFRSGLGPDGTVLAIASRADGRIYVGGLFSAYDEIPRSGFAMLDHHGNLDPSCDPHQGPDGSVWALAQQPDGMLIAGGTFSRWDGVPRTGVARLLPDGHLDPTFDPGLDEAPNETVLALQQDGRLLVAGTFYPDGGEQEIVLSRLLGGNACLIEFKTDTVWVGQRDGDAWVRIQRTGAGPNEVTVKVSTMAGTALPGVDYVPTAETLTLSASQPMADIVIPILDRSGAAESDRAFTVRLSEPGDGAVLGAGAEAVVHILEASPSYEALYGHRLAVEKTEHLGGGAEYSSFTNRLTIRNPSAGASRPGRVVLSSLDPGYSRSFDLPAIAGGGAVELVIDSIVEFAPCCTFFRQPEGSCTNRFHASVLEPTLAGETEQDRVEVFWVINTQPPGGGPIRPSPRESLLARATELKIESCPANITAGDSYRFRTRLEMSDGIPRAVLEEWTTSDSALAIAPDGEATAGEVSGDTPVEVHARADFGDRQFSATCRVVVTAAAAPRMSGRRLATGDVEITVVGIAGLPYTIERTFAIARSPDWIPVHTDSASSEGTLHWIDPAAQRDRAAFYRARALPTR